MNKLLDRLLGIRSKRGPVFGFIEPSGRVVRLDGTKYSIHYDYATEWLKEHGIDYTIGDAEGACRIYGEHTGAVRFLVYHGSELDVDVYAPITESQYKSIVGLTAGVKKLVLDTYESSNSMTTDEIDRLKEILWNLVDGN